TCRVLFVRTRLRCACSWVSSTRIALYTSIASTVQTIKMPNYVDSTVTTYPMFFQQVQNLQKEQFKSFEQLTLEPFERDHASIIGGYKFNKTCNMTTCTPKHTRSSNGLQPPAQQLGIYHIS
ncbi:hypothetical protein SUGI_0728490, partial [Cryptomeria japonica]